MNPEARFVEPRGAVAPTAIDEVKYEAQHTASPSTVLASSARMLPNQEFIFSVWPSSKSGIPGWVHSPTDKCRGDRAEADILAMRVNHDTLGISLESSKPPHGRTGGADPRAISRWAQK